ncbi:hypothetical protein [Hasllibacter sp. MH4015]|uniref:hypothetical protein n=1 Tax=Hasllibacter sp. MH4015 TaxID=2854029 RepID=UPI001CD3D147|nr:hypothetical protein [Hasllibacter sp. MH4015]
MTQLHIFALNEPTTISHTDLTRQKGEVPDLPPLAQWLGLDALDTDRIELFPVSDLGGMALSDYIQLAFTPDPAIPLDTQSRLNALSGAVLLVPDAAMTGTPTPSSHVTEIATIPLAQADHTARLPKADATPTETSPPPAAQDRERTPPIALYAFLGMLVFAVLVLFIGWS